MTNPKRMWVNAPSTLQPSHAYHGVNVLAVPEFLPSKLDIGYATKKSVYSRKLQAYRVYYLEGKIISARFLPSELSEGWLDKPNKLPDSHF